MNDHIKSEISVYLAGELPESRNRQIEAHAAACDKCRNAISKSRAKQARVKREALKKASADDVPNFFLARQRKAEGMDAPSHGKTWAMIAFLVAASGGYLVAVTGQTRDSSSSKRGRQRCRWRGAGRLAARMVRVSNGRRAAQSPAARAQRPSQ